MNFTIDVTEKNDYEHWNWHFMVLFVLNTKVNTVTFNHVSQNSHSAPSGHKIVKLTSW